MKRVCAWCQREMFQDNLSGDTKMGEKIDPAKGGTITHGICPDCHKKQQEELAAIRTQMQQPVVRPQFGEWVKNRDSLESPPSVPTKRTEE